MPPTIAGPTVLFLALLTLAALVVAFLALTRAQDAQVQVRLLEAEVERLRARVGLGPPPVAMAREPLPAPEIPAAPAATSPPPVATAAPPVSFDVPAAHPVPESAVAAPPAGPPRVAEIPPPPVPAPPEAPLPPRVSLEERIGARLPVWIGSIALALAGAFLVKYSFDQGWLSPLVRIVLGVAFGVGLLLLGERMRRSSPGVAQGLSAAGIADLFACFLAGVHLYGLIPPLAGFLLMALTTAVAVALALRQGPMVALIGLVGGFLTPFWIQTGEPDARALFGYLLLLQVGLLAVARRRGWTWIAALSLAGGLLWVFAWLAGPFAADGTWLALFVLLSSAAAVAAVLARPRQEPGTAEGAPAGLVGGGPLLWASLGLGLVAVAVAAQRAGHSPIEWALFGLLAAGLLVLGRAEPAFEGLAWLAAAAAAVLLAVWEPGPALPRFLWTALGLELLFGLGAAAAAFARPGWRPAPRPGRWTALAGAAVLAVFLIALAAAEGRLPGFPWGLAALLHGLAFVAGTALALRRAGRGPAPLETDELDEPDRDTLRAPAAGLAAAATAFISLALPLELERAWLTVAWALEVPALLWLAGRFRLPVLTWLARLAAVLVVARLLFNPLVLQYPIGDAILVNWLLYGYGVPLAAFAAGAYLARRQGDRRTAFGLELGGLGLAVALVSLQICQAFHPGRPAEGEMSLAQWATLTVSWLGLAWLALELARRIGERLPAAAPGVPSASPQPAAAVESPAAAPAPPLRSLELGGRVLALAALGGIAFGQVLVLNPLWDHQPVGAVPLLNLLLWAYGAPAALLLVLARRLAGPAEPAPPAGEAAAVGWSGPLAQALAVSGLVLLFALVSLEVRQLFHGSYLDMGPTGAAERYAYSAAWILFGTVLLALGIARRGRGLRYAALAVMTAAVCKVFLYDTSNLTGLYRVFSFLGLGAGLLLLAWVYQRFVFRQGTVLLLMAGLLAAGAAAAQPAAPLPPGPAGFAYARTVEVPAAGWVRMPLDVTALRHAAAAGSTLQVIGPEGEEVHAGVGAYQPPGERRPVRVLDVAESPSGEAWVLLLDLGPSPPPHERLLFDFDRRVAAPAVQLEGSADGQAWEPLASGSLFRLGGTEGLQRTTLAYPRTDLRYLRLTWPREGGFPEVSRVEVEIPSGPVLALPVERPDCRPLGRAGTVCLLPLLAAGLTAQRLVLEVAGSGSLGYRLDQARDGAWWREIEGVRLGGAGRDGEGARTLHLTLGPAELSGDLLRLELFGDGARPVLSAARIEAAVPTVLFRAAAPGTYTLAYGGVPVPPGLANTPQAGGAGDSGGTAGSPEQAAWREPGPERRLPPPDLPGAGPGEPLPEAGFRSAWQVRAPRRSPAGGGDAARVVRLELPPEVYARVRPDLGDLRLAVGPQGQERQIPFLLWTPHDPAGVPLPAAAGSGELAVARVDRREHPSWTSGFTLDLPAPARTPLTQILVTLSPGPFARPVGLEIRAGRAGAPDLQVAGYHNQPCATRPPLPCRAELSVAGNARAAGDRWLAEPARMDVLFLDGDDPPLSGVAVEVFRRRDVLVFVWPQGAGAPAGEADVRLLAGAPELEAPSYQLARLRDGLLAQPWRPATLDVLAETPADGGRHGRWLLLGTLALAAVALVVLLRRVLKEV